MTARDLVSGASGATAASLAGPAGRSGPAGVSSAADAPGRVFALLMSPEGPADPYPHFHTLRALAPVYRSGDVYFLSRYADCQRVLNDPGLRVQDPQWYDLNLPGWRDNRATRLMYHSVQSRNNPDHNRLRRAVGGAFSPRRMAGYRALVEQMAPGLFGRMADAGSDGAPVDLMEYLAHPLPTAVMGEMLGVPEADRQRFRSMCADFADVMDIHTEAGAMERAHAAAVAMVDYWTGTVAERRRTPRDDLTTELIRACDAGLLTEEEMLGLLIFLFSAGYPATAALIGNATEQLLASPADAERLRRDESFAGAVVEESLRHDSPSQVVPRQTADECTIAGIRVPAGRLVVSLVGAANRDPAQYQDPDTFLPGRTGPRALSFGAGLHFCIGAALSRMEAAVILPLLVRRFPRLAPGGVPVRRRALWMRTHISLPVSLRG